MTDFPALSKTKRSYFATLSQSKRRRSERLFIVEGHKNVSDVLQRRIYDVVCLCASKAYLASHESDLSNLLRDRPMDIFSADLADLKVISTLSTPPDLMAICRLPDYHMEEVDVPVLSDGLYLLLDGVQDPGNMGTIIRTAHWFGIGKIFASSATVDVFNPKTIQSTMGSLGAVEVIYTDLTELVKRNPQLPVMGLQLNGDNLFTSTLPGTGFICMGSEGNGLTDELKRLLTHSYTIPPADLNDHPESLNVAIATAITLAQFRK